MVSSQKTAAFSSYYKKGKGYYYQTVEMVIQFMNMTVSDSVTRNGFLLSLMFVYLCLIKQCFRGICKKKNENTNTCGHRLKDQKPLWLYSSANQ